MFYKKGKKPRPELWNPNTINKFLEQGRGTGAGSEYIPWLKVQDLPSEGICSRLRGWKTGKRPVELFSKVELYHFFTLEWDDDVIDYREQYPLKLEETKRIAAEMQRRHPGAGPDNNPIVTTTNVRITYKNGQRRDCCRSIKPAGSFTYVMEDIVRLDKFVAKLRGQLPSHNLSKFLLEKLSPETALQVGAYQGGQNMRLTQALVRDLNRIIQGKLIYAEDLFANVYISKETWAAVQDELHDEQITRVNRLLLRDAYPEELINKGPFDRLTARDKVKMQIEKRYWTESEKLDWELVTEPDIDMILAKNVERVHSFYHLDGYGYTTEKIDLVKAHIRPQLNRAVKPLSEIAVAADKDLHLKPGTALTISKHLIARKEWPVDFTRPFEPWAIVTLLN